jgi:ABC-2 type transport system permease protein
MTLALVRKLLRDVRMPLFVVAVILIVFQCLWVKITGRMVAELSPLFASIAERAGVMQEQIERVLFQGPGKLVQTLAGGENIRFERATDMLSIGYVHPLIQAIFCIWAIGRAASAITGEIDRGTMELLLAQPVPRWRIILAHFLVDLLVIPFLALCLWSGTIIGYQMFGPFEVSAAEAQKLLSDLPFKVVVNPELLRADPLALGPAVWNVVALMFAVSGVTLAMSAAGRFRGRVLGLAVLVFLVQFLVNLIGQLWDAAAFLRPLTVFYYYQPQKIVLSNNWTADLLAGRGTSSVSVPVLVVLFGVATLGYLVALRTFCRRDLPAAL